MIEEIRNIKIEDFNYNLPDDRIAKHPLAEREKCKLLYYKNGNIAENRFSDVPRLLPEGAMLVYNNTRVINARLRFQKPNNGATIEIFCLEPLAPRDYALSFATEARCSWLCFVGNAKRWKTESLEQTISIDGCDITLSAAEEMPLKWNLHGPEMLLSLLYSMPLAKFLSLPT